MTIMQCKTCRKPFQSFGSLLCADCLIKIEHDFVAVRDYIYENRDSKIDKIIEDTGVEKSVILQFLKEGRLKLDSPDEAGLLLCETCKEPINSGRMCTSCKAKAAAEMIRSSVSHTEPKEPQKNAQKNAQKNQSKNSQKDNVRMKTSFTDRNR